MLFAAMSKVRILRSGLIAGVALLAACTSEPAELSEPGPTTVAATTTTTTTTTEFEVVTTIQRVPADELGSTGTITIGPVDYNFAFECYAAGAGDILALGVGSDPETGIETQAIVQAFLGQTYVAVLVGADGVQELAVDEPAELFVQGDAIRGSALRFVDTAEVPGVGEELGLGAVAVDCQGFAPGLPEGYDLS